MRKSKFTEEQIAMALRQGEAGTPVADICRKLGISQATYFRWKKSYGSLGVPALRELRQLRDENRRLRIFTLIDVHTRECLALKPATGFSGASVAQVLADVSIERPLPKRILIDNKTEFTSKALDAWAYWNKGNLDFSRRGRPGDNAHIEAFNSLVRRECLSQHWFRSLEEALGILEDWKEEYNKDRPHGSLRQMPPARYRAGGISAHGRDEPETRISGGPD